MTLRRLVACLISLLVLTGAVGAAPLDNGTLVGRITDGTKPLPGVTVTLTGPGVSMTQVTDAEGGLRFLGLTPGRYRIHAELDGYGTLDVPVVNISGGHRREIEIQMSRTGVSDAVHVIADAPLVDGRKITTGTNVTPADLERIPTRRDPWAILQQTPGVLVDRINVGGNESGQQSVIVGPGALPGQGVWFIDGVKITDLSDAGRTPLYFNFDDPAEVQVTTGGSDTTLATPGVTLNIVTKRGTNEWRGSGRYFLSDGAFRSDFPDGQAPPRNRIIDLTDYGAELGGPIIKDRLWIWGAYGAQKMDQLTQPIDGEFPGSGSYSSTFGTFSFQSTPRNRLSGTIHLGRSTVPDVGAYARPYDSMWNKDASIDMIKVEDTHIFNSNFYLTGLWSRVGGGFNLTPQNTGDPTFFDGGVPYRSYHLFDTNRPSTEYKMDGSYFFNSGAPSHEVKFGAGYLGAEQSSETSWTGHQFTFADAGEFPIVVLPPGLQSTSRAGYSHMYIQDTMTYGNLTANIGLRYDGQRGENTKAAALPNPERPSLVPGGDAEDFAPEISWNTLAPRIGVSYGLGNGKFWASYGRFYDQLTFDLIKATNPAASVPLNGGAATQYIDGNGNRRLDTNESTGSFIIVGGVRTDNPQFFEPLSRYGPDLLPPFTNEIRFGAAVELNSVWTLRGEYLSRKYQEVLDEVGLVREPNGTVRDQRISDFVPGPPVTGTDFSQPTYELAPGLTSVEGVSILNGDRTAEYQGVTLSFDRRLVNRWVLRGHLNFADWTWNVPDESRTDPNNYLKFGDADGELVAPQSEADGKSGVFLNSKWSWNVQGMYQIAPDRPWGFNLATNVTGRQGYPSPSSATVTGGDGVVRQIRIGDIDDRLNSIVIVDLSFRNHLRFGRSDVAIAFDVLNFLNRHSVLQQNSDVSSAMHGQILEIVSPRILRLGVTLSFK
jgi:hypothetical protein